jgi:hypothetical protein
MGPPPPQNPQPKPRSADWLVVAGWFCVGLYSLLAAHRAVLAAAQIAVALTYATDEILSRKAASKWRLALVRVFALTVFLAMIWQMRSR